ncbi:hypothetical protein EsH8_X_000209 [Colletotrichum jinshuiense]
MCLSWWQKFTHKRRGKGGTSPTPSPRPATSTQPLASQSETSAPRLQTRLWDEAYNKLKSKEPQIVGEYEKFLSAELQNRDSIPVAAAENPIAPVLHERRDHMEQLVKIGLQRTEKGAAMKENISDILQIVSPVKELVKSCVQGAPEAALAWVGVCFVLEIFANPMTEPGINRDGTAYVISRMEWYWRLTDILLVEKTQTDKPADKTMQDQLETKIIELYQLLLLYQMKSICLYNRNRFVVFLKDVIKLDNWADQVDKIKAAEEALREDTRTVKLLELANSATNLYNAFHTFTSAFLNHIRKEAEEQKNREDNKCLQDLLRTDPNNDKTRIQRDKGGLIRDSYRWILDNPKFKNWHQADAHGRLLWIRGGPGKGKTMLLCGIIDELNSLPDPLCYFFCQATAESLNNATAVLRGLIWSLAKRHRELIRHIRKEYDNGGKSKFEGLNAFDVMSTIFQSMLRDKTLDGAIIVIDALDECGENRDELLDLVVQLSSSSHAKWIVSSRNWQDVDARLKQNKENMTLLELDKASISDAVNAYIEHKVDELGKDYNSIRNELQKGLTEKADNTFLWVALVCQVLKKVNYWNALQTLEIMPKGLESLYDRMMKQIRASEDAELCKRILAVASAVYRPITLNELASLVELPAHFPDNATDLGRILEKVVSSCGSFLTLGDDRTIYFVHQSAKDFLLGSVCGEIMPSGLVHQHRLIFSRSLRALHKTLKYDIYNLCAPASSIDDITHPEPNPLAPVEYSCIYWVDHYHGSDPKKTVECDRLEDDKLVYNFLQHKFMYWLEALSLLHNMSRGVLATKKLQALVANTETPRLAELVRDTHRFVLAYRAIMQRAPLQVYASALVFSPTRVRQLFQDALPAWIAEMPDTEKTWNTCVQTLEEHKFGVRSVAYSANGRWLASASGDKTVKVWDAETGACMHTLEGVCLEPNHDEVIYKAGVHSVAFSADSKRLAAGSSDKTVKVWNPATGACIKTLKGHDNEIRSVAFSSDCLLLASGSSDNTVKIWELATGDCIRTLEEHKGRVLSVALSADGQWLASASVDNTGRVWCMKTSICVQTLKDDDKSPRSVAFSADSKWLASSSHGNAVKIWDVVTGTCIQTLKDHDDTVCSATFSADSQRLASASCDNTIKIWNVMTGACLRTFKGHTGRVRSVAFSADSQRFASASDDSSIKIWDAIADDCEQKPKGHNRSVEMVVFSADGQQFASACKNSVVSLAYNSIVMIWDTKTGKCVRTLDEPNRLCSMVFSPDSRWLAAGFNNATTKIWDAATGTCEKTLAWGHFPVFSIAFSADGRWLASTSEKTVLIWDTKTGDYVHTLNSEGESAESIAFSADGQWLAVGSHNTIFIWDTTTGSCVQTLNSEGKARSIAFSADGQWLAVGAYRVVQIWAVATGTCVQTLNVRQSNNGDFSFDSNNSTRLKTSLGFLSLDLSAPKRQLQESSKTEPCYDGYGISDDYTWILKDGKNLLWIPSEYRQSMLCRHASAVNGSTVAWGCASGRVLRMTFSADGPAA